MDVKSTETSTDVKNTMKSSVKIKKPLKNVKPAASAPIFKAVKREDASNSVFSKPVKIKAKVINNW